MKPDNKYQDHFLSIVFVFFGNTAVVAKFSI